MTRFLREGKVEQSRDCHLHRLPVLLSSFIWAWFDSRAWHRSEQEMGWILVNDRTRPKGIGILAAYGVGLILAALVWACVRTLSRRHALRGKNRTRISVRSASRLGHSRLGRRFFAGAKLRDLRTSAGIAALEIFA
jgi:hypothetical protein